jgi:hypothetical protein
MVLLDNDQHVQFIADRVFNAYENAQLSAEFIMPYNCGFTVTMDVCVEITLVWVGALFIYIRTVYGYFRTLRQIAPPFITDMEHTYVAMFRAHILFQPPTYTGRHTAEYNTDPSDGSRVFTEYVELTGHQWVALHTNPPANPASPATLNLGY